jgi:Uma2 family endonuclease
MFGEMVRLGVVPEKEPVYLWKGGLARGMAPNPPHALAVTLVAKALDRLVPADHCVREEKPLAFRREHSQPEPDVTVLRGRDRDFATRHPSSSDAALVIEVADSSLPLDRTFADELASEGVPVYWIVNLPESSVEVHTEPAAGAYREKRTYGRDARVPVVLDGREIGLIAVAEILP